MPSGDLTDVTMVSEDHDGPDDHNDCDNPYYHDDHDSPDDHDDLDEDEHEHEEAFGHVYFDS